jgi:DNA-binding NtrC family response regulator
MHQIKPTILIADDELSVRKSLSVILRKKYNIVTTANGIDTISAIKNKNIDLLLLDLILPDIDGMDVLRQVKSIEENLMVIIVTAVKDTKTAVETMKLGAYDYITKPIDVAELRALADKALEKRALIKENIFLRSEIVKENGENIIGQSKKIQEIYKLIDVAAKSDCPVLISGESGTGKELITRAIHNRSPRSGKPFIVLNCAAIPDNLLESELFGYERGSFTGALERKEGKFELANNGTLFLDEISSMPLHLQAKILRALQDTKDGLKEIERLGSTKTLLLDVRIIAATNTDLKKAIKENKFREDLYYRLNVLPIPVPSLRERKEDIPLLINHFLKEFGGKLNKHIKTISNEAVNLLIDYNWHGNIRELKNLTERLVTLNESGEIEAEALPLEILINRENMANELDEKNINLKIAMEQLEQHYIKRALKKTKGNQIKAAEILGIHRNTLFTKLKQLNIPDETRSYL